MNRVLVLRPEPGASLTVEKARQRGFDAAAIALFEIEPIEWNVPDPDQFDALLLTSANAVRSAGSQLNLLAGLAVYAVGAATGEAALKAGLHLAATGDSGIDQLLSSMPPNLRLLHLCGEDRKEVAQAAQLITPIVVYRAKPIAAPDLSDASGAIALIYSPRGGRRFAELVVDRQSIAIAAISSNAAKAVGKGWRKVGVAVQPNDEALLALAAQLCNNPPPK